MSIDNRIREYWERCTPMSFTTEKWSYEQKRQFRYSLQDYMQTVFRFSEFANKSVLEIGCGAGIDSLEFARHGARVTAVDLTEGAVKLTKELAQEAGLPIKVARFDAKKLDFADNSFDCVYSFGVLHHIPDVDKVLSEIHRVLKPGGKLMVMLYNKDSLLYAYSIIYLHGIKGRLLLDGLCTEEELVARYSERNEGCPYTKAYTKEEGQELFERLFDNVQVSVHYTVIDLPEQRKVKLTIDSKNELGWHLVIKCRKQG
ncbi:MAG: class I SAM-dependent methyltransferase [Chloroflexi bacterium]|nr:class I SAM-dependent methyltransferase [Chloroflexota bacterium]